MSTATKIIHKLHTAEDLWNLPGDARATVIEGELREMPPPPGGEHGSNTITLSAYATVHALEHDLGICFAAETGFVIASDPDTLAAPDWAFISKARAPHPVPAKHVRVIPDLVLETRSPSDSQARMESKVAEWLTAGVRVVWLIEAKTRTLTVYRADGTSSVLGQNETLSGEDVLPGFTFPLRLLFA